MTGTVTVHQKKQYQRIRIADSKSLHQAYAESEIIKFRLNEDDGLQLNQLSGFWENETHEIYSKNKKQLSTTSHINLIKKDGKFDSFTWHTTAAKLDEANFYGIVKTHSLTSALVATLGKYRILHLYRIKDGYISNRQLEKIELLDLYQKRIRALSELELLVNDKPGNEEIKAGIDRYVEALQSLKQGCNDHDFIQSLQKEIDFASNMHLMRYTFDSTGVDSILTYIKKRSLNHLRELQMRNQIMTYSRERHFALTRGDMNSFIEDAIRVIYDFVPPPRDKIDKTHHGIFGQGDERVIFDSTYHCQSESEEQSAILAISFIEKLHKLDATTPTKPKLIAGNNSKKLKVVAATKWRIDSMKNAVLYPLIIFANLAIKIAFGFIELPCTLIIEPLMFGHKKDFFEKIRSLATISISRFDNPFHRNLHESYVELSQEARRKPLPFGAKAKQLFAIAYRNTVREIWFAMLDVKKKLTFALFDQIINDYQEGRQTPLLNNVLGWAQDEVESIKQDRKQGLENIVGKTTPANYSVPGAIAAPTYVPSPGEWNDPLNSAALGGDQFIGLFMHHIHSKHPFAGFLFSLAYIFGGLAVCAPETVPFLGRSYLSISQSIGYGVSKHPISAAISSGCTQGQLIAANYELGLHGPNSWLGSTMVAYEKDPFTSTLYAGTALLLGYLAIYKFNFPWLSKALHEDMGNFPPASLGFVGAKLGIGVYEVFKEEIKMLEYERLSKELAFDETIKLKENYRNSPQLQLLIFIKLNSPYLKDLSARTKHQIYIYLKKYFINDADSLKRLFYDEQPSSTIRSMVNIIIGYPAFIVRLVCAGISSLILLDLRPLQQASYDFQQRLYKDITRFVRAASKFSKPVVTFFRLHVKTLCDIVFNSFLARIEAILFNQTQVARIAYRLSATFDGAYESLRQWVTTPVDSMVKASTQTQPDVVLNNTYAKMLQQMDYLARQEIKSENAHLPTSPIYQSVPVPHQAASIDGRAHDATMRRHCQ